MEEQKKLRILLLEDNPDDAALVKNVLAGTDLRFISECVDTRVQFNASIKRFRPDVILSDHGLPGFNSNEALGIALKERPSAPFILVTGSVSDEYAIGCLREGADDYILKSNLSRLPTAILSAIKKRKLERMKRQALHELRVQNEELSKVNQELDNFVYSVSHNLRGPLATLMGLLNVAKEEDKDHKLSPVHNMMERSMVKLDDTLQEILDYSWNARGELSFSEIDWESMLDTCFQKLEYLEGAVNIEKFIHMEVDEPFFSDPKRIHVILSNLLSNAILYRDRVGDAMIGVEIATDPYSAIISIKDNGIGIRQDILPKIYQMFYRGSEKSQGAGLGLYISREIVDRLSGHMEIDSVLGRGTTVTVTLPNVSQ